MSDTKFYMAMIPQEKCIFMGGVAMPDFRNYIVEKCYLCSFNYVCINCFDKELQKTLRLVSDKLLKAFYEKVDKKED